MAQLSGSSKHFEIIFNSLQYFCGLKGHNAIITKGLQIKVAALPRQTLNSTAYALCVPLLRTVPWQGSVTSWPSRLPGSLFFWSCGP